MAGLSPDDEALIQKFIGLHTGSGQLSITLSSHAASATEWDLCLLAKVVTERTVLDQPFATYMPRLWNVDPTTSIRPVSKNCYLLEFKNRQDMLKVQLEGPWAYRGDIIATRPVASHEDLSPDLITQADVWVQFFNLPFNSLTDDGLYIMAREVGIPISAPIRSFVNGRAFVKFKITINLNAAILDKVTMGHPTLGDITAYCTYEKACHICIFCGRLGHEMAQCQEYLRLAKLLSGRRIEEDPLLQTHSVTN